MRYWICREDARAAPISKCSHHRGAFHYDKLCYRPSAVVISWWEQHRQRQDPQTQTRRPAAGVQWFIKQSQTEGLRRSRGRRGSEMETAYSNTGNESRRDVTQRGRSRHLQDTRPPAETPLTLFILPQRLVSTTSPVRICFQPIGLSCFFFKYVSPPKCSTRPPEMLSTAELLLEVFDNVNPSISSVINNSLATLFQANSGSAPIWESSSDPVILGNHRPNLQLLHLSSQFKPTDSDIENVSET